MQKLKAEVIRYPPRSRSEIKGLIGSIKVFVTSCSRQLGDDIDSYLYIGSGGKAISLESKEEELESLLRKFGSIEKAAPYVKMELGEELFNLVNNLPVIPASSVKGNIRSRLELYFKPKDGKVRSCFISAGPPLRSPLPRGSHGWRYTELWRNKIVEDRGFPCDFTKNDRVCLICDLFGAPGLKGLIEFSDLIGSNVKLQLLNLPYGVKVTASPPASSYVGHIDFTSLEAHELGLLFIGMGLKDSRRGRPVLLGRFKYRKMFGDFVFGRIRYSIEKIIVHRFSRPLGDFSPGSIIQGSSLDKVVKDCVENAVNVFDSELDVIDEVKIVDEIE